MSKTLDIRETKLKNGLILVTIKRDTELFSLNLGIKAGSLIEGKNEKGITHFIEHMLFKGTTKRNNEELNKELEFIGGEYNAYTEFNSTVYTISALNTELENSLEILSDMIMNSKFEQEEIDKERSVVLSEIDSKNDDLEYLCIKKTFEMAFKKSNLKYDILGLEKDIKDFTKEQIVDYYKKYYIPSNAYIVIVSSFEHDYVLEKVEENFDKWIDSEFKAVPIIAEKNKPGLKFTYKSECEQSNIAYLFTFHELNLQEELALRILCYKLGESQNSILFRKLREDKGLVYDIYSEIDNSENIKLLYFFTSVKEENMEEAMKLIEESFDEIKSNRITFTDEDIVLMKKIFKTSLTSTLEDTVEIGDYISSLILDGRKLNEYENYERDLDSINIKDINAIGKRVLENPTVHVVTSIKE
ncbi:M16 family metallopeptidase [Clostridium grantii]|uniref:Predicted Zn-dependent peptidase n=1 Tax=Clostridium grantii DSM 8605 TaxID=1121316 RepID=A0A1M5RFC0_9CLOT|nr:pitrilysin family protein [Clostridium grantii]SHH24796.1 Predicted Zn-dependent peptidase [Clostridium grantii DSM 8605]